MQYPNSVTSIADWAFYGCPSLRNVIIPNSVTNFGRGAFEYCGLTSLMIPNSITSIGTETFCDCRSLTNVVIPNSVTSIGNSAFYYSTSLTSITIPASVTSIEMLAFTGCANLTELYFEGNAPTTGPLYLNATVYYLLGTTGWGPTFGGCPTVLLPSSAYSYTAANGGIIITGYTGPGGSVTIPSTIIGLPVTDIEAGAFSGRTDLSSVIIPNSVTKIGRRRSVGAPA